MVEREITVGKIYSIGCGHCTNMEKDWDNMKESLKKGGQNINVLEFETQKDAAKLEKYKNDLKNQNIELVYDGVPTIFRVHGGKIDYYNGERKASLMETWTKGTERTKLKQEGGKKPRKNEKNYKGTNKKKITKKRTLKNKISKKRCSSCFIW
jgi:hypothetical protein